ncbi:methylamine utilization protein MauE [Nonomuraea sp. SMC257]|uniref:Methylamine utilization protein MauE n=1 Tax=Nonomuraea montanisoli TaxID=2741721 RepID=A0A7Y6I406_9ACTN|nr:MauE/DoxX family redox-associated membrane protein [Nonomuraea montanisoli]NUW31282.1 methylamine utilization protein MauE [Nonomuraea montanisoli]
MEYVRVGCAWLIAVVFAITAVSKARDLDGFARSLPDLVPVSRALRRPLAVLVAALEGLVALVVAVPLLAGVPDVAAFGLALAFVLLAAFTVAIAVALRRGRRAPCRCFGASAAPLGPRHLVRNGLLITATLLGLALPMGTPALAGVVVAGVAGLIGAILVAAFDDLVDLFAGA